MANPRETAKQTIQTPLGEKTIYNLSTLGEQVNKLPYSIKVLLEDIPKKFKLSYAIPYDSSQGRTIYGKMRLTQTDHFGMTLRRLVVGLGRAPEGRQLEVE